MKRLYENIEEINIKGSPAELYTAVTSIINDGKDLSTQGYFTQIIRRTKHNAK